MTFYRVRLPIGTLIQVKHLEPFDTLEHAMIEHNIPKGTIAYIYEFDEPPYDGMPIDGSKSCRAVWSANTGWITEQHPLWGTNIWRDPNSEVDNG